MNEPDDFLYGHNNEATKSLPEYGPSILEPYIKSINKLIQTKSQEVAIDFFEWVLQEYWDLGAINQSPKHTSTELFLKYKQSLNEK